MANYEVVRIREYKRSRRQELLASLGNRCVFCGTNDSRVLQIDHINGGGRRQRKIEPSVISYYKRIAAAPNDFQLLCANCNWLKRHERREHRVRGEVPGKEQRAARRLALQSRAQSARCQRVRRQALTVLGTCCAWCGYADSRALHIDHLHGGGSRERATVGNGIGYYRIILGAPGMFQLLCANCNFIKKHEYDENVGKAG